MFGRSGLLALLLLITPAVSFAQNVTQGMGATGSTAINPFVGTCDQYQPGVGGDFCLNTGAATIWAPFFGDVVSVRGTPQCSPTDIENCGKMSVQGLNGVPMAGTLTDGQYWCYHAANNTMIPCGP